MNYVVYILYSESLGKYYVGHTNNIKERLKRHNTGRSTYTSKGMPWNLAKEYLCASRSEAVQLEKEIKSRGIKRYIEDNNIGM
jgi:putative endonuclease